MIQWPPSPIVEDEAASLAKEHGLNDVAEALNTTEQSVPSRGDVDQYPIIVDSDTNTETPVKEVNNSSKRPFLSKRAEQPCVAGVFRDETGLPTHLHRTMKRGTVHTFPMPSTTRMGPVRLQDRSLRRVWTRSVHRDLPSPESRQMWLVNLIG